MRTGNEQFIQKGFAFYDAGVTAALGLYAVAVYEHLRRFVWRSSSRGDSASRVAFRNGKLSVRVRQKALAELIGVSERSVRGAIRRLEDIGWIQSHRPEPGGPNLYQLGYRADEGMEVFFADSDLRRLWGALERRTLEEGLEGGPVTLPREVRLAMAREWYTSSENSEEGDHRQEVPVEAAGGAGGNGDHRQEVPFSNREPSGGLEIENSEEREAASRPVSLGPKPKTYADPLGTNGDLRGKKEKRKVPPTFALDTDPDEEETPAPPPKVRTYGDRLNAAAMSEEEAKRKAEEERVKKRERKRRSNQHAETLKNEQRQKNLQGTPKSPGIRKQLQMLRGVWNEVCEPLNPSLTIVKWGAKQRGQLGRLLEMYSGPQVELTLRYVVGNWEKIRERYKFTGVPSLGLIVSLQDTFVAEAAMWGKHRETLEELDRWNKDNPYNPDLPKSLKERVAKANKELSALGLGS
jgi:hypothetical protein